MTLGHALHVLSTHVRKAGCSCSWASLRRRAAAGGLYGGPARRQRGAVHVGPVSAEWLSEYDRTSWKRDPLGET